MKKIECFYLHLSIRQQTSKATSKMNSQTQMTEDQIDELIISVASKLQQKTFEAGKHDRPWCEEAEGQHRMFLCYIPFEKKKSLYEKFCEDLKKAD